jgi:hypothetical protein
VADARQLVQVVATQQLAPAGGGMRARHRIGAAVDEGHRHRHLLERADPARALLAAFGHVAEQLRQREVAVVRAQQGPQAIDDGRLRRRALAEDRGEVRGEARLARGARYKRAEQGRGEQALHQARAMHLGEHAAVQEGDRAQGRARLALVELAGQQLLRHGVAVVVGEHVVVPGAFAAQQPFAELGLLGDAVAVAARLRRIAEAQQVERDQRELLRQRLPQRRPVPACRRKAVDQQQHRQARLDLPTHEQRAERRGHALAAFTPVAEFEKGHRLGQSTATAAACSRVASNRTSLERSCASCRFTRDGARYTRCPVASMARFIAFFSRKASSVLSSGA